MILFLNTAVSAIGGWEKIPNVKSRPQTAPSF